MKKNGRRPLCAVFTCLTLTTLFFPMTIDADQADKEDAKYQKSFDIAIDHALAYLSKAQLADGSFPGGMPKNTAVASLCVMAFLAKGYSPGLPPYGDTINRAVDFVLASQGNDGTLIGAGGGQMYSHCISSLMLGEVSGMPDPERQKKVQQALTRALKVILDAQRIPKPEAFQGGWRYQPNSADSDISQSGWALLALWSARNNGASVPKEAIDDAVKFIMRCRNKDGGFAYQPGSGSGLARSGLGLLCLELSGRHRDELNLATADYVLKRFKEGWNGEFFYYGMYYCAQGMFQVGEEQWKTFAPQLYDVMLKAQSPDGSWPMVPGGSGSEEAPGPCFRTAMAVLALSVSYRQLPSYQR